MYSFPPFWIHPAVNSCLVNCCNVQFLLSGIGSNHYCFHEQFHGLGRPISDTLLQTVELLIVYCCGADKHLNGSLTTCSAFMIELMDYKPVQYPELLYLRYATARTKNNAGLVRFCFMTCDNREDSHRILRKENGE